MQWPSPDIQGPSLGAGTHVTSIHYGRIGGTKNGTAIMIHVSDLTKYYTDMERGKIVALDGISFDAMEGEIFGLLGPNGAGKTTCLRILSTVLQPTSGTATINGYDVVTQATQVRYQIGFVSANTAVYDRMTAWEMVEYFGRLFGIERDELRRRMEDIFDRFQMNEFRDMLGGKMSTGMKQKVSIARAIVHDPPVIILDEATSGLDVLVARTMINAVSDLRDRGKTIIYSTHIMREAERLCDRVAIIHHGRVLAHGTIEEMRDEYKQHDLEDIFFDLISKQPAVKTADEMVACDVEELRRVDATDSQ